VLTLYTYFRSSAAFRTRIALNLKGLSYEPRLVHLPAGEQKAPASTTLNPQGLVPTLIDRGHTLTQSLAIIEYLDEVHPGPRLLPVDPLERARVRALSMIIACEIHPLNNLRVLKYLKQSLNQEQPAIDAWYRHWCIEGMAAFEQQLGDGKTGGFCHGDSVTMADVCLVPQIFNCRRFDVDLAPYPRAIRIFDACMKLKPFDDAQPSRQPDAPAGG
jgi:maleylpyruvate isomerase